MNWKKLGLATLAGGAAMLIVGGVWEGISTGHLFYTMTHSNSGPLALNVAAYLVLGGLMAYMYPMGYEGGRPHLEGLRFGALVGVLLILPHGLALAAPYGQSILYVFENTLWHAVEQGIGGLAIAYTYVTRNKLRKK